MNINKKIIVLIVIGLFIGLLNPLVPITNVNSLENQEYIQESVKKGEMNSDLQGFVNLDSNQNSIVAYSPIKIEEKGQINNVFDTEASMHDNWPKSLYMNYTNPIVVADIDNSGTKEIIVCTSLNSDMIEEVYVWNENGTLFDGWPQYVDSFTTHINTGNLDNDGFQEIICSTNNGLYVWDYQGQLLSGWPKYFGDAGHSICDINNDSDLEIIATDSGHIYVWDYQGQLLSGWPVQVGTYATIPLVANLNSDGEKEVVAISKYLDGSILKFNITVLNSTGSIVDGWPQQIKGVQFDNSVRSLSAGDIDNDNHLEIILGDKEKIYVFNGDGSSPQGWPVSRNATGILYPIVLSDINIDGTIEIIEAKKILSPTNSSGEITAYDSIGTIVQGFPIEIYDYEILSSPVIADINNDGMQEFHINCVNALVVYTIDGSQYSVFPSQGIDPGWRPVNPVSSVISDIDNDTYPEEIFASIDGVIHVEDIDLSPGFYSWPQYQHDYYHSGIYEKILSTDICMTEIIYNWNLISIPFNMSIQKQKVTVMIDAINYTWNETIDNNFISDFIFGWNRTGQYYTFDDILQPGFGYWVFSYVNCSLWAENVTVFFNDYITDLETSWNIMSVPYNQSVSKTDILVNDMSWIDAVTTEIISDFVFGWDRLSQTYTFTDTFEPGYCYWMYAYQPCTLKKN